jgi:signal transduction histidine kinase
MPARELLHSSWEIVGPQLNAAMANGSATWAEEQPLAFDRRGRPEVGYFTYSYSPIHDDDGAIGGVLLVTQDTTARVLAERRIETLRELTTQTLDAGTQQEAGERAAGALARSADITFALIYRLTPDGQTATCVASRLPAAGGGMVPTTIELGSETPGAASLVRSLVRHGGSGRLTDARRFVTYVPAGAPGWHRAFVAPFGRSGADQPDGFVVLGVTNEISFDSSYRTFLEMAALGVGRSIAASGAREAERQRADAIAELDRAKTALFSNASHDLRTPLALILGHLEDLVENQKLEASARIAAETAHRNALRMQKLVNALLDFSRIEAGAQVAVLEPTDIGRLTRDIAAMFEPSARRAGLGLTLDCPRTDDIIKVDRDAWERIVSNLVSNALKFTRAGEIRVSCGVGTEEVQLSVRDTGIGIPKEELEGVFARFYRGGDSEAQAQEGSGLGLALVRELVLLHGGTIEAQSELGVGTEMIVRMPAVRPSGRSLSPAPRPVPERQMRPETPPDAGARPVVLVADDDGDMRDYLGRMLSAEYTVMLAGSGAEALDLARRHHPSLVITDTMMPELDGFTLISELRREPRTGEIPVIILSARADSESTVHAMGLGADDYVVKPFGARELRARVRATLLNADVRMRAGAGRARSEERRRGQADLRKILNDLRAAQRRVAAASDAERRRIARDLHDGAQQRLMAIRLELRLLGGELEAAGDGQTDEIAHRLDELCHELDEGLDELRELAHGLYPQLLASDGLPAALSATARRSPVPVTVHTVDVTRAPRSIESTAYFCCLEAVQNAVKHGGPGVSVTIHLAMEAGTLTFQVSDDGAGFNTHAVRPGYGLINLRDRLEALGGEYEVISAPGRGTTVTGRLSLP